MIEQVEGMWAYSKHGLSDSKNCQFALSLIGIDQKCLK